MPHPKLSEEYSDKVNVKAVNEIIDWNNKINSSKNGQTMFSVNNEGITKDCGHQMGEKCGCLSIYGVKQ